MINLTPHPINLVIGGKILTVPPSGTVIRINYKTIKTGEINIMGTTVPVFELIKEGVVLPPPSEEVIYLASTLVVEEAIRLGRGDFYAPGPNLIRDNNGNVIGADSLQQIVAIPSNQANDSYSS